MDGAASLVPVVMPVEPQQFAAQQEAAGASFHYKLHIPIGATARSVQVPFKAKGKVSHFIYDPELKTPKLEAYAVTHEGLRKNARLQPLFLNSFLCLCAVNRQESPAR